MITLYHMLGSVLFTVALPVLPLVWIASEKRRANLLQRLGLFTGFPTKEASTRRIWVHALSVGEVKSALPLVRYLRKKHPDWQIIMTASTRTGYHTACEGLGRENLVAGIGYFPFDLWFSVMRVVKKISPDLVCLVETDLWPGFLSYMKQRHIPVVLVNARLSTKAWQGYLRMGPLKRMLFSGLTLVTAQTVQDAQRFESVGVHRVPVAGNIKFDQPPEVLGSSEKRKLRDLLGIAADQHVLVAGSTHPGEEEEIFSTFERVKAEIPNLKLILAPRDPGRAEGLARESSRTALLTDSSARKRDADILIINTLGVLARAYAVADVSFIGGSLVPLGGHNPLEPAVFGVPVFFGPYMEDFHEVAGMLLQAGGAQGVASGEELARRILSILAAPELGQHMGQAAKAVFFSNSGAVERTVAFMEADGLV